MALFQPVSNVEYEYSSGNTKLGRAKCQTKSESVSYMYTRIPEDVCIYDSAPSAGCCVSQRLSTTQTQDCLTEAPTPLQP